MPSRAKKRAPSKRVYTSEPSDRQVHFPARRRSINPTKPTPLASRTRQQTLTQIDFVTKYMPQDDDVDLNYLEKDATPKRKRRTTLSGRDATTPAEADEPSKRKRRRTLPAQVAGTNFEQNMSPERKRRKTLSIKDTPSIIETRGSKRRKIKQERETEKNATSTTAEEQTNATRIQSSPPRSVANPPRTPVTARKVEIPSSQSPADTPLSTQRMSSFRSPIRSPLRARSTNARVPLTAGLKGRNLTGWHPKLEVKSSVSWENEDSQPLTVSPYLRTVGKGEFELRRSDSSNGLDRRQGENQMSKGALQGPIRTTEPFNRPMPSPQCDQSSKTEIRDSDDEEEEEEGEGESSPHDMTNTTEPIEHDTSHLPHSIRSTSNELSPLKGASTSNIDVRLSGAHTELPVPPQTPSSSNCELGPKDDDTPTNGNTPSSTHPALPPFSSAETASAQLFNDLYRQTQTQLQPPHDEYTEDLYRPLTPTSRLLDSQSQFGFICRDYTPSPPPLSPITAVAPVSSGLENHQNSLHGPHPRSRSPSPRNHPRTSQVSTQSPVLSRTVHQKTFPKARPNPPHLQPSQFSTQSQSPLKNPDRNTLPALPPQQQQGPSNGSRPPFDIVDSEFTIPALPRQAAHVQREQGPSSPCPSDAHTDADADADFLPPQMFLQSSPLLAPSLPSSPLSSKIRLQYDSQGVDDDERQGEDGTEIVSVEGDGDGWDGRIKTTSQLLPESMFDQESQNIEFGLPPGFSSQLMEQD